MAYAAMNHVGQLEGEANRQGIAIALYKPHIWLFDTFEGLPEPSSTKDDPAAKSTWESLSNAPEGSGTPVNGGKFNGKVRWNYVPLETVQSNMQSTGFPSERVHFVKGKVEDTLTNKKQTLPERISLLRLDTDWYDSTKI